MAFVFFARSNLQITGGCSPHWRTAQVSSGKTGALLAKTSIKTSEVWLQGNPCPSNSSKSITQMLTRSVTADRATPGWTRPAPKAARGQRSCARTEWHRRPADGATARGRPPRARGPRCRSSPGRGECRRSSRRHAKVGGSPLSPGRRTLPDRAPHDQAPRAASRISRFISRTASRRPTKTARDTIAWPMWSSRTSGSAATGCTLK